SKTLVQYNRAGGARIEETERANPPAKYTPSLLVNDGKTQYEVVGSLSQYLKADALPAASGLRSSAGLAGDALAVALGWKQGQADKYIPVADETVEGKTLKVFTKDYVIKASTKEYNYQAKLWVDTATKLPVRYSLSTKDGDAMREISRTEFSDWKLDAPIDAAKFAWTVPAGVTEYKAPERPALLAAGTLAPDFTVAKWGGGDLKLSDYRGKVVILDFWATWCGPCQASMPHVEKVYQSVKDKDVVVIGLCVWDEQAAYDKWMPANKDKYTFTFGFDPAGRGDNNIAKAMYKVSGIPTTYIIGKDGKVVEAIVGYDSRGDVRVEEALAKIGIKVSTSEAKAVVSNK
ncbi:MAG: redoxin domain-containing protein, partial [Alphaproteobacteria bacterium]